MNSHGGAATPICSQRFDQRFALFQKRSKAEFKNGSMNWAWTFEIFRIKGCKV